ncbi:MAG: NAD(P)/FAD-dependent oxidoreductase [Chryseolinea sp.]
MKRATIIGGGLAGLISAIQFARAGVSCRLVEKKHYPFHRVCGEYISNEVAPFLKAAGLYPSSYNPPQIEKLQLSSIDGKCMTMPLDMGGFGISRYVFDNFLYEQALKEGVEFLLNDEVTSVVFDKDRFQLKSLNDVWESELVVGAFGKRSKLDHTLNRSFIAQRSPYIGVKYHIRNDNPDALISLHNFPRGYCGMSNIEDKKTTLCYLAHRDLLRTHKTIGEMEDKVVFKNPALREIFSNAAFLFDKPEVINEISFATKAPVENHMLMVGDSAGMIAPLCGNGMAMAIQSGRLMAAEGIRFLKSVNGNRFELENNYAAIWRKHFIGRLWRGRQIQKLFGKELTSRIAISAVMNIKPLGKIIVKNTHGEIF